MISRKLACWVFIFLAILGHVRQTAGAEADGETKPKRDDALRQELLKMAKEDQEIREKIMKSPSPGSNKEDLRMAWDIDGKNIARMKEIIAKHGWPGKSLVGNDGTSAAWLLVQHADRDLAFQKRCLTLLERAVKAQEASARDLAYLTDRVLVAEKKKQVYGTQFREVDGNLEPEPIEDEKNVDLRRKEVGLPNMAEYRKRMEEKYKTKTNNNEKKRK
jgi:hypothetical protein